MRLTSALAAILAFSFPLCGQQNAHAVPIPTIFPDAHGEQLPNAVVPLPIQTSTSTSGILVQPDEEDLPLRIPLRWQMDQHVQPIPTWKEPATTSTHLLFQQVRFCVIVEDTGTDYKYVEGTVPGATKPAKQFADGDIHRIIGDGGWVKILKHGYSNEDLDRERRGCMEGSKIVTPPPAEKP